MWGELNTHEGGEMNGSAANNRAAAQQRRGCSEEHVISALSRSCQMTLWDEVSDTDVLH